MSDLLIVITGPTGVGKSTIASKLAGQLERCVNIDADQVKHMIVTGFIYDDTPEGVKQWELLGENIASLAHNFKREGYKVIINGYINEPAWNKISERVELTHKFLLMSDIDVNKARDLQRHESEAMGEEAVAKHQNYFSVSAYYQSFTKLDTSQQTVDETVASIRTHIELS